jgi:hypothetical protein
MLASKSSVIHERSNIIPIAQTSPTSSKESRDRDNIYCLKQNFFDPTKSSPPNDFMLKLCERMHLYGKMDAVGIKDGRRDRA